MSAADAANRNLPRHLRLAAQRRAGAAPVPVPVVVPVAAAAAPPAAARAASPLGRYGQSDASEDEPEECCVCLSAVPTVVGRCGHRVLCAPCAVEVSKKFASSSYCPMCGQ
jgi:hypothetical protein